MKITILTLFDKVYHEYLNASIIKNAIDKKIVEVELVDFRQFSKSKNKKVDDYQYGGGPGMVLMLQPIVDALKKYKKTNSHVLLTSPSGKVLNQTILEELAKLEHIILIAGHYEGFDSRIENYIDDSISIGDYVLTGGELPTMVLLDGIIRLLPSSINKDSLIDESFSNNLLDYPIYTKPVEFDGYKVPEILLSGDHKKIAEFRKSKQMEITKSRRPDLYKKFLESTRKD